MKSNESIFQKLSAKTGQVAVLIDPEEVLSIKKLKDLVEKATFANIDYFFVGGSTVTRTDFKQTVSMLKRLTTIPIVIFPGDNQQLSSEADALLYLSLLSGRNPEYLIGQHVKSAQEVFGLGVEVIPTAYLLIDGGNKSSVAYVSQTTPIPRDKKNIAVNTALAGHLLGNKAVYFDAGSGAKYSVDEELINQINTLIDTVVIVGGGVKTVEQLAAFNKAGAHVIVIGNRIEENIDFLLDIREYIHKRV